MYSLPPIQDGTQRLIIKRNDYNYINSEIPKDKAVEGDIWCNVLTGKTFVKTKIGWEDVQERPREQYYTDIKVKEPDIPYIGLRIPTYETHILKEDNWVVRMNEQII